MRLHRPAAVALLAAMVAGSGPAVAHAGIETAPPAQSRPAPGRRPTEAGYRRTGRLVVGYRTGTSPARRSAALATVGATVQSQLTGLDAAVIRPRGPIGDAAMKLRQDPAVRYVEPESAYRAFADIKGAERTEIGVDAALVVDPSLTGTGVEVAVVDTAVNPANPDLTGRVVVPAGSDKSEVFDPGDPTETTCVGNETTYDCAHGTAVATVLAAADDGVSNTMVGIAPDATIVSYNVFRSNGFASSGAIAAAVTAAKDRSLADPQRRLRVINLSLGGSFDSTVVAESIAAARAAGIVVVVAAGNDGGELPTFPAGDPFTISVGASRKSSTDGKWYAADFSNRGDVDVLAPGYNVKVWYPDDKGGDPAVVNGSGTSFAAPMVSGIAAILAQQGFTGDVARAAIVASAESRNGSTAIPPVASGAGRADVLTAFQLADGTAPYTAAFINRGGQLANVVGRRTVEVLRVDPDTAVPNDYAGAFAVSHGSVGTATTYPVDTLNGSALMRTTARYATPGSNLGIVNATLTANAPASGEDEITLPLRFLDPSDGPEGTNASSGVGASVALKYGSRSRYVRSVGLHAGATLKWDFEYADETYDSTIFVWMPQSSGESADAMEEPWDYQDFVVAKGTASMTLGTGDTPGRWKLGWVTFSNLDNGTYYLRPHFTQPKLSVTAPALVSSSSTTPSFKVSWAKTTPYSTTYDVQWTTKTQSGTSWVTKPWSTWLSKSTLTAAVFGASNKPTTAKPGLTYYVRVRGVDDLGNAGAWVTKRVVDPLNDNSYGLNWSGGWTVGHSSSRFLGDVRSATAVGTRVAVWGNGFQFQIVGDRCGSCGQFRVYVDGVLKATVDTHGSLAVRQVLWNSGTLPGGIKTHKVEVVVLGTAGRPKVSIDAAGVTK